MTPNRSLLTLATLAALALPSWHGLAQTAPAKPAATPPQLVMPAAPAVKAAGPKTLGGKAAVGKVLTRDELRTCLKRLDGVNASSKDLEQRRATLDKEKEDLVKSGDALKADRADVTPSWLPCATGKAACAPMVSRSKPSISA